jgi:hypothetical protein
VGAINQSLTTLVPFGVKLASGRVIYDMAQGVMLPFVTDSPGQVDMWYYNNTASSITAQVAAYAANTDITIIPTLTNPLGDTLSPASYYEIIS